MILNQILDMNLPDLRMILIEMINILKTHLDIVEIEVEIMKFQANMIDPKKNIKKDLILENNNTGKELLIEKDIIKIIDLNPKTNIKITNMIKDHNKIEIDC